MESKTSSKPSLRRGPRVTANELDDYQTTVRLNHSDRRCQLGNISQTGLCVILDGCSLEGQVGAEISGTLFLPTAIDPVFSFNGTIVWRVSQDQVGFEYTVIGVEFRSSTGFPDRLIAAMLAVT